MLKAIKIRLYPTRDQKELLETHFNSTRYLYNLGLEYKKMMWSDYGIQTSKFDLMNQLPDLKEEATWLKSCKAECLQNTFDNLDSAFKNFFRGAGFPRFKSRKHRQSFTQKQNFKVLPSKRLVFLKREIKFRCSDESLHELLENKIKRITWLKTRTGKYFASCLIEIKNDLTLPKSKHKVGIDLGLKHFLITSDGEFVANPRFLRKSEKKLKRLHRLVSRKRRGSQNRKKAIERLARAYEKITNQRNHFLHQVSNKLINENQVINVETLNVKGMVRNRKLSKAIHDASWSRFIGMLTYKADWRGRELNRVERFYPSSKTCSECGAINKELTLKDRVFECPECGHREDRDLNAARNILNYRDESTRIDASGQQAMATG